MRGLPVKEAKSGAGRPDRTSSASARSSAVLEKIPIVSSDSATNFVPWRLMLPKLGFKANAPQ